MNILLHDFGSYIQPDLISHLTKMGHRCKNLVYPRPNPVEDDYFEKYVTAHLKTGAYDCVISTNFHPLLARICCQCNIKYLAWSYDSPISKDHPEYFSHPTSYVFLFDNTEVQEFHDMGLHNVYHLPLAVDTERLASIPITDADRKRFSCEVSFVGRLYQSKLNNILSHQDDYTIGYVNALTDAQFKLVGFPLLDDVIDDILLCRINNTLKKQGIVYRSGEEEGINKAALSLCITNQITHNERIILLRLLNHFCDVHLYSDERNEQLLEVPFKGPVTYSIEMPKVFRLSKINLCPTARGIRSGIPLRMLDIIGAGGFLLSNAQPELTHYFRPDIDIVWYNSVEEAIEKARYYLSHEEKRLQIQQNSYAIVKEKFSYPKRIATMFQTAGL